jgi:hypothetical protein
LTLADYVEAAILVEATKRPKEVEKAYADWAAIVANLKSLVGAQVPDDVIESLMKRFLEQGLVEVIQDQFAGDYYKLNHRELSESRVRKLVDGGSLVSKYEQVGNQFLHNAIAKFSSDDFDISRPQLDQPEAQIPAADRIVSLNDNSEVRDELLGRLDELVSLVHGDNDEDQKLPERERVIAELRAGKELLKAPTVRVKAIWAVLGTALAWLSAEFAGGLIGELAGLLFEALKPLLGI